MPLNLASFLSNRIAAATSDRDEPSTGSLQSSLNRPLLAPGSEMFSSLPYLMSAGLGYNPLIPAHLISLSSALKVPISTLIATLTNQADSQKSTAEKPNHHYDAEDNYHQSPVKKQKIVVQGVPKSIAIDPKMLRKYFSNLFFKI